MICDLRQPLMARTVKPLKLELVADYRQIHLRDPEATGDLAEAWTVQATEDRIASAEGILGIGTAQADTVKVEVHVLAAEPPDDSGKWEHVTEASIRVSSGELAVLGCTDYLPDAKRFTVSPGDWRVRASHAGLQGARERIRLQLWPGKPRQPRVLVRWSPAPAAAKKIAKAPRNAKQAAALARSGQPDAALPVLVVLAAQGDGAAAASAAELFAFRGDWRQMVPHAMALLANPRAVHAGNVFTDLCRLIRRAARELGDPSIIQQAAAGVPAGMEARRDAVLLRDFVEPSAQPGPPDREGFARAVKDATEGRRFQGKPRELAAHCFALASGYKVEDELLARWDPSNPQLLLFDRAVDVARVLARRGERDRATELLMSRVAGWYPVDHAQVAPVILLVDPWLSPLMTPALCARVLATPRGAEAGQ
jgi:hypothetical protein